VPHKLETLHLADFELDALAAQVRSQARALGIAQVSELIAVTDGGNRAGMAWRTWTSVFASPDLTESLPLNMPLHRLEASPQALFGNTVPLISNHSPDA
jgi:hypothetical protein